jgi:hypothetical protein
MRAALLAILAITLSVASAPATTIHVPQDYATIQAGIDAAAPGDTVLVACGSYAEHEIALRTGVRLFGETGDPDCVVVDAQGQGCVLVADGVADLIVAGITLTGGFADNAQLYGGGLLCRDSELQVRRCAFVGNVADYRGGGAYCATSSASFSDCVFRENVSESGGGGGGLGLHYTDAELSDCLFIGNSGIDGAGAFFNHSSPSVEGCVFVDNDGQFFGGAIACHAQSSPTIRQCSLVRNEAYQGSGIWVAAESVAVIENSIIAYNRGGHGVYVYPDGDPSDAQLSCSDVFGNEDGEYGGAIEDQTGIDGNISAVPFFCDLEAGDLTLASVSPCLPENNDCGVLMGAYGLGCTATSLPPEDALIDATSWSALKTLY